MKRGASKFRLVLDLAGSGVVLIIVVLVTGCRSPSQYISPRIEGRVLDAETKQVLAGVQVQRASDATEKRPLDPVKGATILQRPPITRTQTDGTFVLASRKGLDFLLRGRWYTITINFERSGYQRRSETYTLGQSTNTPSGEPLVDAGEVLMDRIPK